MNYRGPRKRLLDGRWDYAVGNDEYAYAVGYCAGWDEAIGDIDPSLIPLVEQAIDRKRPFRDKYHDDGHDTPEAAIRCFKEYVIDHNLEWRRKEAILRRCLVEGCDDLTHDYALFRGETISFCEDHRVTEIMVKYFTDGLLSGP